MPLNRAWIESHIPHQGTMCLLDEVLDYDAEQVRCRSGTHRALDNPLRANGRLGVACGIEYAAQAMAIHGALAHSGRSEAGLLASVRDVRLAVARLDDIEPDLICSVVQVAGDALSAMYRFTVIAENQILLEGRASVVLDAKRLTRAGWPA
jgi:predicted hotdog family 3-hydroxylacyl-ACP dehydratase